MLKFPSAQALYDEMLKVEPGLKTKLKFVNLFAPKEFLIKSAPNIIPSVMKALTILHVLPIYLEGEALLVRNVPLDLAAEKIQGLLQQHLKPQILFVDMFRPNQQGALHRGVGKIYLANETWTDVSFQSFRESITPTEIMDPFIRVPHVEPLAHLGPMYIYKWKSHPPKRASQSAARPRSQAQAAPDRKAAWTRPPASPSPSPEVQILVQKIDAFQKQTMTSVDLLLAKSQALNDQLASRVTALEDRVQDLQTDIKTLNVKLGQVFDRLTQNSAIVNFVSHNVANLVNKEGLKVDTAALELKVESAPLKSENKRRRSPESVEPRKAPAPDPTTSLASHQSQQISQFMPAATPEHLHVAVQELSMTPKLPMRMLERMTTPSPKKSTPQVSEDFTSGTPMGPMNDLFQV